MSQGRLIVVGSGLITPQHITQEAVNHIRSADRVYHIAPDPLSFDFLNALNENLVSLADCYSKTTHRRDTYNLMVDRVMEGVRSGLKVVALFYGHPGVFVTPSHELIEQTLNLGIPARMLPGISAEDCLFADLGVDPGTFGCQSYESTFFMMNKIELNISSPVILWQLGVIGDLSFSTIIKPADNGIAMLIDKLGLFYNQSHPVIVYEAPDLPGFSPRKEQVTLSNLSNVKINEISTLYIPAASQPTADNEFIKKWQLAS